jgi:hypothetical protein
MTNRKRSWFHRLIRKLRRQSPLHGSHCPIWIRVIFLNRNPSHTAKLKGTAMIEPQPLLSFTNILLKSSAIQKLVTEQKVREYFLPATPTERP